MKLKALWYWREHPYEALIQATPEELLQFGPYTVMYAELENLRKEVTYVKNPILKYLLDISALTKLPARENITYKEAIATINEIMRDALSYDNRDYHDYYELYAQYTVAACKEMMTALLLDKRANRALESAMLNYAPIVPYGVDLRKKLIPRKAMESAIQEAPQRWNMPIHPISNFWESIVGSEFTVTENVLRLVKYPFAIMRDAIESTINPLGYVTSEDDDWEDKKILSDDVWKLIREDYVENRPAIGSVKTFAANYFICAYAGYLLSVWGPDYITYIREKFVSLCRCVETCDNGDFKVNLTQAAEAFEGFAPPDDKEILPTQEEQEDIKRNAEKKFGNLFHSNGSTEDDITNFPVNLLTSYIYTARRFKIDQATNMAFLQQHGQAVSDPSYLENNIMICKYKPTDKAEDERILTPAVDLADVGGFTYVIISLDRDGHVTVDSQQTLFGDN